MKYYLAIDIGASSGRHIVGWRENGAICTDEVYRFPNGVKSQEGSLVWNIEALLSSVKEGIKQAFIKYPQIESLAIDTWAVDYVLLNDDREITPCYAYRDSRTQAAIPAVHEKIPFETLYKKTGIQFQPFNTIYQFYSDLLAERLQSATDFLMIPEYLSYKLTGVKAHEYTNATTTGLLNANGEYDQEIIAKLGLPARLFSVVVPAGTAVGEFTEEIRKEVGGSCKVIFCASHDTASAVEGIPMPEEGQPYISSGTWSLLGIKVPHMIADDTSRAGNWSNEGGIGYYRYQKNIMGMWVVNRLRDELCPNKPFSQIVEEAQSSAFEQTADINAQAFLSPESMKEAFDTWFAEKAEKPREERDYFNCAFLSLAHGYRVAVEEMRQNVGREFTKLYLVGGGAKNNYLNALTEKICKLKVAALPIEATALGNLKIQMERSQ